MKTSGVRRTSETTLRVEYRLEARDVGAWWAHARFRSPTYRSSYWLNVGLVACVGGWIGAKVSWSPESRLALGLGGLLGGAALGVAAMAQWARSASQASAAGSGGGQFGLHSLDVGEEGIAEKGPAGSHSHHWGAVEGLWETPGHLFVGIIGGYGYVVPKRDLSPEVAHALKAELQAHIANRRRTMQ